MVITEIGLNLSSLTNITAPNITISSDPNAIITNISTIANADSSGYLTFAVLFGITLVTFLTVTDKSGFTEFGFSDLKGFIISLGFSTIIGLVGVMAGIFQSYKSVVFFGTLFLIMIIFSLFFENKE